MSLSLKYKSLVPCKSELLFRAKDLGPIDFGVFHRFDRSPIDHDKVILFSEYFENEMHSTIFISAYKLGFVKCYIGYIKYSYVSIA